MSAKWTKEYDNESGQYYYLNAIDGSSTWEKPADYVEAEGKCPCIGEEKCQKQSHLKILF